MEQPPTEPIPFDRITVGMEYADLRREIIDDVTAKYIAGIIPASETSATRMLHYTGAIDRETLLDEMHTEGTRRGLDDFTKRMVNHLGAYAWVVGDRPAVEGWDRLH